MKDVNTRFNHLVVESAQTVLDGAYLAQRQNAQLFQSWYGAIEGNHQASRDIVGKLFKQGQEVQNLWLQYWQDSFQEGAEVIARTTEAQFRELSEQVAQVTRTAANGAKVEPKAKAEAAAK